MVRLRMFAFISIAVLFAAQSGCSSVKSIFATEPSKEQAKPITNPFGNYLPEDAHNSNDTMIFRAKKGDGAVEVELPRTEQGVTDFVLPMPRGNGASRALASEGDQRNTVDETYANAKPTQSDRELTRGFSKIPFDDEQKRNDIEHELGLVPADEPSPERQRSYLASMDHIKQLYRTGRYEAGLMEVDHMIRDYPTDPKLHEMRGTLLDRLGKPDLAMTSWKQALRFDPNNESLKHFIDRRSRAPAGEKSQ